MPFFWITIAFLAGIFAGEKDFIPVYLWTGIAILYTSLCVVLSVKNHKSAIKYPILLVPLPNTRLPVLFLPTFVLLGAWCAAVHLPDSRQSIHASVNDSSRMVVTGWIVSDPDMRPDKTMLEVRAVKFQTEDGISYPSSENLLVVTQSIYNFEYGDELVFEGTPILPNENEDFSYREYLAGRGILTIFYYPQLTSYKQGSAWNPIRGLYAIKERSMQLLTQIYPMPEASIMQGVLLGDDSNIPENLYDGFRASGTSHIIAISGYNVSIVAALFIWLMSAWVGKWRGSLYSIAFIVIYTIFVGASPSVVRAAIMGCLGMIGANLGRRAGGLNSVALTSGLMLAFQPFLYKSVSFQLSVSATLGLVFYADFLQSRSISLLQKLLTEGLAEKLGRWISEYLLFTIAAQITSFPFLLMHFHSLPLASFVSNPLVLPAQSLVMIFGGISLISGWISLLAGKFFAVLCTPFVSYTLIIIEWTARLNLPFIVSTMWNGAAALGMIVFMGLFHAIPSLWSKVWSFIKNYTAYAFLLLLAVALLGVIHLYVSRPDGLLTITWMGGEKSAGILIQTPSGNRVLINGGEGENALLTFLDRRIPFLDRSLDAVIVTQPETNQDGLYAVLPLFRTQAIYSFNPAENPTLNGVEMVDGDVLQLDDDLFLERKGNQSLLTYQNYSLLLAASDEYGLFCDDGQMIYLSDDISLNTGCHPLGWIIHTGSGTGMISLQTRQWFSIKTDGSNLWMEGE